MGGPGGPEGPVAPARELDPAAVRYGPDGLVAAVVQDADDGRVLMVAWQDAEAVAATLRTGEAHFHSRSRGRLWRKGETSGNTLAVVHVELDCDADAVLIRARPSGPACHTGARSCFDLPDAEVAGLAAGTTGPDAPDPAPGSVGSGLAGPPPEQGFAWLERLWATIEERARRRPEGSYTSRLLDGGVDAVVRKVSEEATEVLMAARDDAAREHAATKDADPAPAREDADPVAAGVRRDQAALAGEMADLLYHVLVLCAERGLPPSAVIEALRERHRG